MKVDHDVMTLTLSGVKRWDRAPCTATIVVSPPRATSLRFNPTGSVRLAPAPVWATEPPR